MASASDGLSATHPSLSARSGTTLGQKAAALLLAGGAAFFAITAPAALLSTAMFSASLVFAGIIALRWIAAIAALRPMPKPQPTVHFASLPTLTALVPLYREANMVVGLIDAIMKLDYPIDRLEVKLLVEIDDRQTIAALMAIDLPPHVEIIPVPPNAPRTKPRALNYGLSLSSGEFVVVFDAEDRPDPAQPREAVAALRAGGQRLAVVQAPLLIDGATSWIARQFSLEYAVHFRVWLPFLARRGSPLALGGTSNYFRRDRLVAAGGWDAWNVTEDADLGFRLARFGGRAAMIDAPTWEEAPSRLRDWFNQRTRWMKGHIQTWLVLNRNPLTTAGEMGLPAFLMMQLTFGGALLASLLHLPILFWLGTSLLTPFARVEGWYAVLFFLGYGSVLCAVAAARTRPKHWLTLMTLPIYWPLGSLAVLTAIWELGVRPHFWAKTPHGAAGVLRPAPTPKPPTEEAEQLELHFDIAAE